MSEPQLDADPSTRRYKIFDYNKHDDAQSLPNFETWKCNIIALFENEMVAVNWFHYKSPLKSLGIFGEYLMGVKLSNNHGLYHR